MIALEFDQLPPLEQAQAILGDWQRTLAERLATGAEDWEIRVAKKYANWSRVLVEAVEAEHLDL